MRHSWAQKFLLALFGVFLTVVLLELFLRTGGAAFYFLQNISNKTAGGAYRIMCVGESTTAMGGEDSYPRLLEYALNQKYDGRLFSVINKGRPAQQTGDLLAALEDNINKYRPHMIIFYGRH